MFKTEMQPCSTAKILSLPLDAFNIFLPAELRSQQNFLQTTPTAMPFLFNRLSIKPNEYHLFEKVRAKYAIKVLLTTVQSAAFHPRLVLNISDSAGATIAYFNDQQQFDKLNGMSFT